MKLKGYLYGCLSSVTYGLIPLFALPLLKKGMRYDSLLFYRFLFATLLLGVFLLYKKESLNISKKELIPLLILGILFALSAQFLFWSYSYLSVGIASTLLFLYPIFVAIIMTVVFKERISIVSQLAIIIAFAGIFVLSIGDGGTHVSFIGVILILCSALSYALYIVIINKSHLQQLSGYKLTFYALLISTLFFFIKSFIEEGLQHISTGMDAINILSLSILPTILSCVSMVYAVRYIGSTSTAVLGALEPVTAVIIGVFVFHEHFTFNLATGVCFIVIAVSMIILSDKITPRIKIRLRRRHHV